MTKNTLSSLIFFKSLKVGPVRILPRKVSAMYELELMDGQKSENEFVYTYEEDVFNPDISADQNLCSMMMAQVALNYGLFCKEIILDGLYDNTDKAFLNSMLENTSREIYVNKLLEPNPFLILGKNHLKAEKKNRYTNAILKFTNISFKDSNLDWEHWDMERNKHSVLSSGGKDSLLSYGLLKELKKEVHPVFVNESGRHWFTALNAYRFLKEIEPNTGRVWCNSDRIFSWVLRLMPIIRKDFSSVRSDEYPIRLWTVAVFIFGVIPLARKRKSGRIIIGNEYDCSQKLVCQGIKHYNGLYDQSRYFDNALSRYYLKKGWNLTQFSILRSLSEVLILKILVKRYPQIQQHQVSCHASHEKNGRMYPCGKCEKCRRIIGMLTAIDEDPQRCGYTDTQIESSLKSLTLNKVKQIGSDAAHLYYMLLQKGSLEKTEFVKKTAKAYPDILKLRFDRERSVLRDMPLELRNPLYKIYLQYADGSVRLVNRTWEPFNVLESLEISIPYPFEGPALDRIEDIEDTEIKREYLWAELTWPEIQERLKIVDTAILPCGSVEQHGRHLPVDLDFFDAEYLARRVAAACSKPRPFVLPVVPYGVSYHHEDFKGTISVTNNSLACFVYDIGLSLAQNGIKKMIIINGHGDNSPTLNYAAQRINRDAGIFVCVDTGESSDEDINKISETPNDIHAGEIETSTALTTRPHLVKMENAENKTIEFSNTYLDFTSRRGVPWYVRTKLISETGVMGNPLRATAKKGEKVWEIMVAHLIRFIEEIKNSDLETLFQRRY